MVKKILIVSCIPIIVISMAFTSGVEKTLVLNIGDNLPSLSFSAIDVSGSKINLVQSKSNNGLLVLFTSSKCSFTVESTGRIKELTEYAVANNIGILSINSNEQFRSQDDSYNNMKTQKQQQDFKGYYVMDENAQLANAFGATRTPEVFLFDKNNKLIYKGATDDSPAKSSSVSKNYLKDALTALVAGKEISVKETKAIGCEVKRKVQ